MKTLFHILSLFFFLNSFAQKQLWKGYFSYNNVRGIAYSTTNTYFATDNSIIVYNDNSGEKKIYNTINGLKIDNISTIAYAKNQNKIIVGNNTGNIAIVNLNNDNILYLNDIANKNSLTPNEKIIYKIITNNHLAYIATGYGISEINMENNHFGDSYYIGDNGENKTITDLAISDNQIFALIKGKGIKKGNLQNNLIDYNQWQLINNQDWENIDFANNTLIAYGEGGLFSVSTQGVSPILDFGSPLREITVYNNSISFAFEHKIVVTNLSYSTIFSLEQNDTIKNFSTAIHKENNIYGGSYENGIFELKTMKSISPDGPYSNNVFVMRNSPENELWAVYGGHDVEYNPYIGGIKRMPFSVLKNNKWQTVPYHVHKTDASSDISFDPRNKNRAYLSSYLNGLTRIDNIAQDTYDFEYAIFNAENSNISKIDADQSVRVLGIGFDKDGIGWATSSLSPLPLTKIDQNTNITAYPLETSAPYVYLKPEIDNNYTKWIVNKRNGLVAFNEKNNKMISFNSSNSDLPSNITNVAKIDKNNQLWIGTSNGLRIIPNVNLFMTSNNIPLTNIVIDDNGTAQELFYQQNILDIFVDGSNNKWIAIADAGVFYISANGQEEIYHFDTSNSPLPSNNIHSIDLNQSTGEVFFATNKGIVSVTNEISTVAKDDLNEVFVYPNPVRPDFLGEVKISNLTQGALVKIADTAGNLVYETTSTGGTALWNTHNFAGNRVPSGVYIIFVTSKDGTKTATRKLTIVR